MEQAANPANGPSTGETLHRIRNLTDRARDVLPDTIELERILLVTQITLIRGIMKAIVDPG